MTKRVFAALLALVMLFSALPMSVFAEDVAVKLDTGHKIDVTFKVLYVDDADFSIGYNYETSEKTQFVCQYTTNHSDTAYTNHTIAISDIKAAADRATVNSGYQIVGWSKEANANPTTWPLNKSGTTACNKGTTIYLVAKNPIPTVTYELIYKKNDGTDSTCGSDASVRPTRAENFWFTVRTKAELSPTREGYTFLGWSKDSAATTPEYTGGEPIKLEKANPRLNLYAVWEKDEPQHEHDWEWKDNGNGTHTGNCKGPNCDATTDVNKPHVDENGDGKCDKCGADMPKPQPDGPTDFGKEQLAAMQVNVQCETDAAHAKIYHFGELDGCYSTSDVMTNSNGGYYVTVTLTRAAVVTKFNGEDDSINGGKTHEDTTPNATSWTWTWNASEKTWNMDNAPMTDAWATIVVKCNGSQPEVKPTVPTVKQLLGGFVIKCVSSGKHNLDAGSLGLSVALKSVSTAGTYKVVSTEATKGTDGRYYVEVKVNNVDAYLPQYEQEVSNIKHERNDGVSNELTLTYYYNEETKAWAQDSEPVVDVKCKEEELFPVELVIFRNGDTSKAYKKVRVAMVEKGTVIKAADYPIANYYDGTNSGGNYDFYGWYDDGLWNTYKGDPANPPAGLTTKTVNGWTNLKCMVYDYEKVVYFKTEEALKDYQNDHSKTDGILYSTTARKGDTLPTADAPAATREGYTFLYWSREGQTGDVTGQTVNGWTNLYANWEKIPDPTKENIEFNGRDKVYVKCDIYGGAHSEFIDYIPGSYRIDWDGVSPKANLVFTAQSYLDASQFANDHVLAAVSDPEVSTQIVFEDGKWQQLKNGPTVHVRCKVTLTYDAHAPEGKPVTNMPDPLKVTQTLDEGSTTTFYLSENIPACEGYVFLGWTSDTTLDVPTIPVEWKTENNGANWKTTTGYPGYTLYAVWQKLTPVYAYMQPTHKGTALTSKDAKITAALKGLGFEEGFNQGKKFVTIGKTETDKTDLNDVSKQVMDEIDNGTFATYEKVHATTAVQAKIDWNELKLVDDAEHKGYTDDGKIEGYHLNGTLSFCDVQFKPNGDNVKNMPADVYHLQYTDIALTEPSREGYTFKGWSVQEDKPTVLDASNGAGTLVKDSFYVRNDTIFTAQWEADTYTITYEYNDKDIKNKPHLRPQNPTSYTIEDAITLKPIEAAGEHGKQFVKWRCDLNKDGVAETITKIPKGTTGNLTISAHWDYPVNYTVFDKNGDKIDSLSKTEYVFEDVLRSEEGYKLTALTQDGYTFDGWYQDDADLGKTEKLIKDQTLKDAKKWELYGKLTPKEYTVTATLFLNDTNTGIKKSVVGLYDTDIDFDGLKAALKTAALEADKLNKPNQEKIDIEICVNNPSKAPFTATTYGQAGYEWHEMQRPKDNPVKKWTVAYTWAHVYTYYDVDFETGEGATTVDAQLVKSGDKLKAITAPTKEGYEFTGWTIKDTDTAFNPAEDAVTRSMTLVAGWKANEYTVTFDPNSGTIEKGKETKTVTYDALYGELPTPTRTGYTFNGWYLGNKKITAGSTVETAEDHTLTASWSINSYRLTIKYLNKSNGKVLAPEYSQMHDYNTTVKVESPSIPGYKFYDRDDETVVVTMPDEDVTHIVYYVRRTGNGGGTYDSPNKAKKTAPALTLNTADHFAFINGYPDGSVQPEGNVTRAETAAILYRIMGDDCQSYYKTTSCSYSDVARGDWFNTYVATLENAGVIVDTRTNGKFRPNDAITRAELASMIAQFAGLDSASAASFNDVGTIYWAAKEIAIAAKVGWINGYPDGSFRPDRNVTRAELMAMVNRALGRTPKSEDDLLSGMKTWRDNANVNAWYYLDVQEATNDHTYTKSGNHETWKKLL